VTTPTIIVLEGDETGQELLVEALRVLDPTVTRMPVTLQHFDLSLGYRRKTKNQVVHDASEAMKKTGLGLKAATITPGDADDVGSPNALLRDLLDAQVILRTGRRIPRIHPIAGVHAPIAVVRMAVDGSYGAKEWREGEGLDEIAWSTQKVSRRTCRIVAEFAFRHAEKTGAKIFGGPKYTVSPLYEGMLKEEMDAAAKRHPAVRYDPQLIDATYALLLETNGEALVIPALNRDGDVMSDLVLKMFGSIAGAESLVIRFDDDFNAQVVMAEAPHGTAPSLQGKNVANPMAMILASAALLGYIPSDAAKRASRAIREATLEAVYDGIRTSDIGGSASTTQFTDEVIRRTQAKMEIWETM
jgi:isocitrate dehydrogenase (NAD+)